VSWGILKAESGDGVDAPRKGKRSTITICKTCLSFKEGNDFGSNPEVRGRFQGSGYLAQEASASIWEQQQKAIKFNC